MLIPLVVMSKLLNHTKRERIVNPEQAFKIYIYTYGKNYLRYYYDIKVKSLLLGKKHFFEAL